MADPFIGQITAFGFPYAPRFWAFCDGSTVPLKQYGTLYALIGNLFGGDGSSKIGLPNLNGASPCGTGQGPGLTNRLLAQSFGQATVLLDQTTMPTHTHNPSAVGLGRGGSPNSSPSATSGLAKANGAPLYNTGAPNGTMAQNAVNGVGGSQPHNNLQPFIAMNYSIALVGTFPEFN